MNWYLKVLKEHYADFSGRARRKEYWMFKLIHFIIIFLIGFLSFSLIGNIYEDSETNYVFVTIFCIYFFATLIPSIALSVRRFHDIGKSGWMLLITLIPLIGVIWLLVLLLTDSNSEENLYGANPKEETL